jgi:hypothetical protein
LSKNRRIEITREDEVTHAKAVDAIYDAVEIKADKSGKTFRLSGPGLGAQKIVVEPSRKGKLYLVSCDCSASADDHATPCASAAFIKSYRENYFPGPLPRILGETFREISASEFGKTLTTLIGARQKSRQHRRNIGCLIVQRAGG